MHLFYTTDIITETYTLRPEESRHCKVLRLKTGDIIYITNGQGLMLKTIISNNTNFIYEVQVVERIENFHCPKYHLHIAISPTKHKERFEWFLEKSTEIGISEITPLLCKRTEKAFFNKIRMEKIIQSAMKQSFSAFLPVLNPECKFSDFISNKTNVLKYIAFCSDEEILHLKNQYINGTDCIVLIGPEGDFTPEEIEMAKNERYKPISLGENRYRTETAGVLACSIIKLINF